MSGTLAQLAHWAAGLNDSAIPPDVLERASLQHLSTAGSIRSVMGRPDTQALHDNGPSRGKAWLMAPEGPASKTSPEHAIQVHSAAACLTDHVDNLFWGQPGPSIVPTSWASANKASLTELLTATVIANEVAARLGASTLFSSAPGLAAGWVHTLGAAAAAARLAKLDEKHTLQAYALALGTCGPSTWRTCLGHQQSRGLLVANAARAGNHAVELAARGVSGPTHILDRRGGLFDIVSYLPLRAAFTGLGTTWLTRTLAFPPRPGSPFIQVPVQAVHEILRRHVKAADKRLRVAQLKRIEVRTGILGCASEQLSAIGLSQPSSSLTHSISASIGALVCAYEFGPKQVEPGWIKQHQADILQVASRVEVSHDWAHTEALVEHLADVAAPLFAGLNAKEIKAAGEQARVDYRGVQVGPPPLSHLLPGNRWLDRLLQKAAQTSGDLSDLDERALRYPAPTEVKLYTSRGGWWPERRDTPEGAPGASWDATVKGMLRKFAGDRPELRQTGTELLEADGSTPARQWVSELLA